MAVAQPERASPRRAVRRVRLRRSGPELLPLGRARRASASCCSRCSTTSASRIASPLAFYDERWVTQARVERVEARPGAARAPRPRRSRPRAVITSPRSTRALRGVHAAGAAAVGRGRSGDAGDVRPAPRARARRRRAQTYPRCGHIPMVEAHRASTRDLDRVPRSRPRLARTRRAGHDPRAGRDRSARREAGRHRRSRPRAAVVAVVAVAAVAAWQRPAARRPAATAASEEATRRDPRRLRTAADRRRASGCPSARTSPSLGAELTPRLYAAPREHAELVVHGSLRVREAALYNLDLDRGLDPTRPAAVPGPARRRPGARPAATSARAPTSRSTRPASASRSRRASTGSTTSRSAANRISPAARPRPAAASARPRSSIKRAWGEALTPFGMLAAGRMGAHFGLGIAANGGDCEDCDHGDAADRVAFVSPLAGHLFAIAYDFASTRTVHAQRATAAARSRSSPATAAAGPDARDPQGPLARPRSRAAPRRGLTSVEYGAYVTHRTQDRDVPARYLPTAHAAITASRATTSIARGFSATTHRRLAADLERARSGSRPSSTTLARELAQPSLIPGAAITEPVTSNQLGFAVETDARPRARDGIGFDGGYASGDSAPGFGAFPAARRGRGRGRRSSTAPQANPPRRPHRRQLPVPSRLPHRPDPVPRDHRHDHRRGLRPAARARDAARRSAPVTLEAGARADRVVGGRGRRRRRAASARSAIELDPELRYASRDGFALTLDYGVFAARRGVRQHQPRRRSPRRSFRVRAGVRVLMRAAPLIGIALAVAGAAAGVQRQRDAATRRPRRRCRRACRTATAGSPPPSCRSRSAPRSPTTPATQPHRRPRRHRTACWTCRPRAADDAVVALGPVALATQWYADQFPAGQFVVDAGGGLDGIYHQDDQALWLHGTASHDAMPAAGKTLIVYAAADRGAAVPARPTARLLDDGRDRRTATIAGLPFVGTDQVDVDVAGGGRLDVPYVRFSPVLRVRTHVTRTPSTGDAGGRQRTTHASCSSASARSRAPRASPTSPPPTSRPPRTCGGSRWPGDGRHAMMLGHVEAGLRRVGERDRAVHGEGAARTRACSARRARC